MVQPGKKEGQYRPDYKDKANISLTAIVNNSEFEADCSVPDTDRSSQASDYCLLNITTLVNPGIPSTCRVVVCVPLTETRDASLWELWVSPEEDSRRVKGSFADAGRQRFGETQQMEEFNTWLTLTSVVGKTGVGKSTVASFLSGNMSMFTTASTAQGTTTVGTDMSPIIPSQDYVTVMTEKLQEGDIPFNSDIYIPTTDRPLFILDSEGMSFRGDEFDFITSGPAAIIAKMIVWITTDRIHPADVLEDIREYLNGLDRISMGDESATGTAEYGKFVIVLNKMQNTDQSDDELLGDLMGYNGNDEEMETIAMLEERFEDISIVGLPMVHLQDGEDFGFPILPVRFREGLNKLTNKALEGTESSRNVEVASEKYEMNSTNSQMIISLLINAANKGNIDLTDPCNVLFTLYEEQVISGLAKMDAELVEATKDHCDTGSLQCSTCVCEYQNAAVQSTYDKLSMLVTTGVMEAEMLCADDKKLSDDIGKLISKHIDPWTETHLCRGELTGPTETSRVCDISHLQSRLDEEASLDITLDCDILHLCGNTIVRDSELVISTKSVFIASGYQLEQLPPPAGLDGEDSVDESGSGTDGTAGQAGKGITITIGSSTPLTGSETHFGVTLRGANGGNGGAGGDGRPGIAGEPGQPGQPGGPGGNGDNGSNGETFGPDTIQQPCSIIKNVGSAISSNHEHGTGSHGCCGFIDHCNTHSYYQQFQLTTKNEPETCNRTQVNGKNGGNGKDGGNGGDGTNGKDAEAGSPGGDGGSGGDGGEAGQWLLQGNLTLDISLNRIGGCGGAGGLPGIGGTGAEGGKGGLGGKGGAGGAGGVGGDSGWCKEQDVEYETTHHWHTYGKCGHHCDCHTKTQDDGCESPTHGRAACDQCNHIGVVVEERFTVEGEPGLPGHNGAAGHDGNPGQDGASALSQPDGQPGRPGIDSDTCRR